MDFNKMTARVKGILLSPKTEWPVIEAEQTTTADLYKNYILLLAAIPAVFTFLKLTLVGVSIPFAGTVRVGFLASLEQMLLSYLMSLVVVFLTALVVAAVAPTFGGQKDRAQALKTIVYVSTVNWLAGVALLLPGFGLPVLFAVGIYSVYLLYLGLPVTMKCAREKAGLYAFSTLVIVFVLNGIGAVMMARLVNTGSMLSASESTQLKLGASDVISIGALEDYEPVAPARLAKLLPEALLESRRIKVSTDAKGDDTTRAAAEYENDASISITDYSYVDNAKVYEQWVDVEKFNKKNKEGGRKAYRVKGRPVYELWSQVGRSISVLVGDRFKVKISADALSDVSMEDLRYLLEEEIDLKEIEALK